MTRVFAALALLAALASPAWADSGILPDPTFTPGQARTTNIGEVCSVSTRELRHWSRERDDHILAEYGVPHEPRLSYSLSPPSPL
jgi:hypothetical protein